MALRRILNNQIKLIQKGQTQVLRGGHGWDRPDVPVELNPTYVHKRQLSIFDVNMWMYDQVFPEYVISYNEIHLRDQWNAIKESLSQSAYFWAIMAMITGFYYLNTTPRQQGIDTNDLKGQIGDYYNQYKKRSGNRPNFIGLDVTGENSIIHTSYERQDGIRPVMDGLISGASQRRLINQEANNFVSNIEKACEQRILKRGNQPAKH